MKITILKMSFRSKNYKYYLLFKLPNIDLDIKSENIFNWVHSVNIY